jgi:hypothetical protein
MKAIIIYDDFDFAARAKTFLHNASHQPDAGEGWEVSPWRADVLRLPLAGEEALLAAGDAHLIILAGNRVKCFPVWLQRWMERWTAQRQIQSAALAVISDGDLHNFSNSTSPSLAEFAQSRGLRLTVVGSGVATGGVLPFVQNVRPQGQYAPPNP